MVLFKIWCFIVNFGESSLDVPYGGKHSLSMPGEARNGARFTKHA
jgi:hypothetical protein